MKSIKCECGNRFKPHTYLADWENKCCFSCRFFLGKIRLLRLISKHDKKFSHKSRNYWKPKLEEAMKVTLPFDDISDSISLEI